MKKAWCRVLVLVLVSVSASKLRAEQQPAAAAAQPAAAAAAEEEELCKDFDCPVGFKVNEAYAHNPGKTPEECCDALCEHFKCNKSYGVPSDRATIVAATHQACCELKCSEHSCVGHWTADDAKADVVPTEGADLASTCCQKSCASITCDPEAGRLDDLEKATKPVTGPNGGLDFCCKTTCKAYEGRCGHNKGIPADRLNKTLTLSGDDDPLKTCCDDTCLGVRDEACLDGWNFVVALKDNVVGDLSEGAVGCCEETCAAYTCSHGWAASEKAAHLLKPNDTTCCLPTCELHTCSAGLFKSTDATRLKKVVLANQDDQCCDKGCHLQPENLCSDLGEWAAIEPQNATAFRGDAKSCCEPQKCKELRASKKKADMENGHCNTKDTKASCEEYMVAVLDSGKESLTPCEWHVELKLCVISDEKTAECAPSGDEDLLGLLGDLA